MKLVEVTDEQYIQYLYFDSKYNARMIEALGFSREQIQTAIKNKQI